MKEQAFFFFLVLVALLDRHARSQGDASGLSALLKVGDILNILMVK